MLRHLSCFPLSDRRLFHHGPLAGGLDDMKANLTSPTPLTSGAVCLGHSPTPIVTGEGTWGVVGQGASGRERGNA